MGCADACCSADRFDDHQTNIHLKKPRMGPVDTVSVGGSSSEYSSDGDFEGLCPQSLSDGGQDTVPRHTNDDDVQTTTEKDTTDEPVEASIIHIDITDSSPNSSSISVTPVESVESIQSAQEEPPLTPPYTDIHLRITSADTLPLPANMNPFNLTHSTFSTESMTCPEPGDGGDDEHSEDDEEEQEERTLFVAPYRSEQEMYDSETMKALFGAQLPRPVQSTLGDVTAYNIPTQQPAVNEIERDLRKIKVSLLEYRLEEAEQRKYAKLCILKHYDLLSSIYKRYCKIGRDTQWMTMFGWISMVRDCGLIRSQGDEQRFSALFHRVYQYHHDNMHSARNKTAKSRHSINQSALYGQNHLHDKDPWTGIWMPQKFRQHVTAQRSEQNLLLSLPDLLSRGSDGKTVMERYREERDSPSFRSSLSHSVTDESEAMERGKMKFRKIGDRKIIGFLNDSKSVSRPKPLVISGWLNRTDFKKAKLATKAQRNSTEKRTFQCHLIPPETFMDPLSMKIKWERTRAGAPGVLKGTLKLFKFGALEDDDADLPMANYVGLSRHEFFDALLSVARLSDNQHLLYLIFDEFVRNRLDLYIYRNMVNLRQFVRGKEVEEAVYDRLRADAAVIRLFNKYSNLQTDSAQMEEDAWCALAEDLLSTATSMEKRAWKRGGRPSANHLIHCFTMSQPAQRMDEQWIDLHEFFRCLLYFTAAIYRDHPGVRYKALSFKKKLNLVLKWCHRLDAQAQSKVRSGVVSPRMFRSGSLSFVKRRKEDSRSFSRSRHTAPGTPESFSTDYGIVTSVEFPAHGAGSQSVTF